MFLFVGIYELTQIFQNMKTFHQGADPGMLIQHYLNGIPYAILLLQPFSFLFASVYVVSSMANSRELIAIVSTGTSVRRITLYIMVFTISYYFLTIFVLEDLWIFPTYQQSIIMRTLIERKMDIKALDRLKDNNNFSIYGSNNLLYIVEYYNAVTKELKNITIVQYGLNEKTSPEVYNLLNNPNLWLLTNKKAMDEQRELLTKHEENISLRIDAEAALWNPADNTWVFSNGIIRAKKPGSSAFIVEQFKQKVVEVIIDPPDFFERLWYPTQAMTKWENLKYIENMKKSHQDAKKAEADYLMKYSYPLGIILVVLTGIGILNMSSRKISIVINIIMSMGVFIIYYVFFAAGLALTGKGVLSPMVGSFGGSFIFIMIGIVLYARVKT
jgi:lipopolysaccharide export LptBFGC system permease protein LptF